VPKFEIPDEIFEESSIGTIEEKSNESEEEKDHEKKEPTMRLFAPPVQM
jgi:hypothetical protein